MKEVVVQAAASHERGVVRSTVEVKELHAVVGTLDRSVGAMHFERIAAVVVDARVTLVADEPGHAARLLGHHDEKRPEVVMNQYGEINTRQLRESNREADEVPVRTPYLQVSSCTIR